MMQSSLDVIVLRKRFMRIREVGVPEGEIETSVNDMLKEWWEAESKPEEESVGSSGVEAQLEKGDMDLTLRE